MKRLVLGAMGVAVLAAVALWAAVEMQQPKTIELASVMPDGALLYLESSDFRALLSDWNESPEKRTWLKGDNYQAFSRSRLFSRLSQAGDEFSAAANITTDDFMLRTLAGHQSALALYDIGELKFVYVTSIEQHEIENTPLWQMRNRFEQRTVGATPFYVHADQQSGRTAAFAARDGYLVLGTSVELVSGVLDRLEGSQAHSLSGEAWFVDALKQAPNPASDLRMVLNLDKVVPSPYFRSYWAPRNISEMKQYRAALSDLRRGSPNYREDRVLLRRAGSQAGITGDISPLTALAPSEAVFYSAQASPEAGSVVSALREGLLDLRPSQSRVIWSAPGGAAEETAGSASQLEERIDVAPVILSQSDPYQPMRRLIAAAHPSAMLTVYTSRAPKEQMFVAVDCAIVIDAADSWNLQAVQTALVAALRPGLTVSGLGVGWTSHSDSFGSYAVLDGRVPLALAIRGNRMLLASSESLLGQILAASDTPKHAADAGATYAAEFRHTAREQTVFRRLVERLDKASSSAQSAAPSDDADSTDGKQPAFFSGNVESLNRMFARVSSESIVEKDQGALVTQSVEYRWLSKK